MTKILNIKIDGSDRDFYNKICREQDTTMSQDIRKFIRSRIEEYTKSKQKNK